MTQASRNLKVSRLTWQGIEGWWKDVVEVVGDGCRGGKLRRNCRVNETKEIQDGPKGPSKTTLATLLSPWTIIALRHSRECRAPSVGKRNLTFSFGWN